MTTATVHDRRRYGATDPKRRTLGWILVALLHVLIAVMFWWFLWGVPGAFLAVPMVAAARVIADHTEGLTTLGEFLGA